MDDLLGLNFISHVPLETTEQHIETTNKVEQTISTQSITARGDAGTNWNLKREKNQRDLSQLSSKTKSVMEVWMFRF